MPIEYDPDPGRYRGTGTVFIARDVEHGVWGYWDSSPDQPPSPLEKLPDGLDLRAAAEWGLERTQRVLVRTESSHYFVVGSRSAVADVNVQPQLAGEASLSDLDEM